ncbi:hypothetical protein HWI79_2477 [Cryptosporidium felis]|nr:hypothetical protein HWI79_2477 [Cryptosporidium felis]
MKIPGITKWGKRRHSREFNESTYSKDTNHDVIMASEDLSSRITLKTCFTEFGENQSSQNWRTFSERVLMFWLEETTMYRVVFRFGFREEVSGDECGQDFSKNNDSSRAVSNCNTIGDPAVNFCSGFLLRNFPP